jgi:nicotinic acetylcholine receptor
VDKSEIDHFANTLLMVFNNSNVFWVPPAKFQVRCDTDYIRWPYDVQTCMIVLGSWAHDGLDINFTLRENHTKVKNQFTKIVSVSSLTQIIV